jgi:hypothetical protein
MVVDTTEEPNGDPVCMEKRIFIFTWDIREFPYQRCQDIWRKFPVSSLHRTI